MGYVNVANLKGWMKQSSKGNDFFSLSMTITDLEAFIASLEETEYGLRIRGALFFGEDDDAFGSFSVKEEEDAPAPAKKTRKTRTKTTKTEPATKTTRKSKVKPAPVEVEDEDEDEWEDDE